MLSGGIMIFKKEKGVIDIIVKHINVMEEAIKIAKETIESYLRNDKSRATDLALKVNQMEMDSDHIQQTILDQIYKGSHFPLLRQDVYYIVKSIAKVANAISACCNLFLDQRPQIPEDMRSQIARLMEESSSSFNPLKNSLLSYLKGSFEIDNVREEAKKTQTIKMNVLMKKRELTRHTFSSSSLEPWHKIQIDQCLSSIEEISKQTGSAAEEIDLILFKWRS
jgi:predicted phosphate transport protein (TIGR00153 family)